MIRTTLIALTATAALLAGCGDDDDEPSSASMQGERAMETETAMKQDEAMEREQDAMSAAGKGTVVKAVSSQFGRVIADRKGEAFYLFDKEHGRRSECYGACAAAWPPVLTKGKPRAGGGARAAKLGSTRRRDGKLQVTYAGHPLYYYVDDAPGKILCHDVDEFGGTWLVVTPGGQAAA